MHKRDSISHYYDVISYQDRIQGKCAVSIYENIKRNVADEKVYIFVTEKAMNFFNLLLFLFYFVSYF